jgi:tRNA(fMet)-specific endonuclease VapC
MPTPRYLLDTNMLSEPLRPHPNEQVLAQLRQHMAHIATASLVIHELLYGCHRLPEGRKRQHLFSYVRTVVQATLPVFDYDTRAALWQAEERARLEKIGICRPFIDGQIAAIAKVNGLTLVTRNAADFGDYDLSVENWFG